MRFCTEPVHIIFELWKWLNQWLVYWKFSYWNREELKNCNLVFIQNGGSTYFVRIISLTARPILWCFYSSLYIYAVIVLPVRFNEQASNIHECSGTQELHDPRYQVHLIWQVGLHAIQDLHVSDICARRTPNTEELRPYRGPCSYAVGPSQAVNRTQTCTNRTKVQRKTLCAGDNRKDVSQLDPPELEVDMTRLLLDSWAGQPVLAIGRVQCKRAFPLLIHIAKGRWPSNLYIYIAARRKSVQAQATSILKYVMDSQLVEKYYTTPESWYCLSSICNPSVMIGIQNSLAFPACSLSSPLGESYMTVYNSAREQRRALPSNLITMIRLSHNGWLQNPKTDCHIGHWSVS